MGIVVGSTYVSAERDRHGCPFVEVGRGAPLRVSRGYPRLFRRGSWTVCADGTRPQMRLTWGAWSAWRFSRRGRDVTAAAGRLWLECRLR